MLPNYIPWGGLEVYRRVLTVVIFFCENGTKITTWWRNVMLPNDAPCGGLEIHQRGVTWTIVSW